MDFNHNGTKIELLPSGKFQTTINGRKVSGPSLDSLKKQIDNAAKNQFQTFKALRRDGWEGLRELTIVGVKPPRKNAWRARNEFVDAHGNGWPDVIADTPENRAALAEWQAHKKESDRIAKERKEAEEAIWERVVHMNADDFAPKKPTNGGA